MPAITIASFADRILDSARKRRREKTTVRQKAQVLRELMGLLDNKGRPLVKKTTDLNEDTILAWLSAYPERTPTTFRSHLRALRFMTRYAARPANRWLRIDPFADEPVNSWIREDSRPCTPRRRWSKAPGDVRRLLARSDADALDGSWLAARDRAYAYALFLTGARPGEIQRLEIEDFDPRARTLRIRPKWIAGRNGRRVWWKPKTVGAAATLAIGDELVDVLRRWIIRRPRHRSIRRHECTFLFPGERFVGPWTCGKGCSPLDHIKALAERAGIGPCWQKSARKCIGTHREIGLTPQGRRRQFRHADEGTGDSYDEQEVESRRGDAARIETFYLTTGI